MTIYDAIQTIEKQKGISKLKDEAAIIFILEAVKSNPVISVQDLVIKGSAARIQVARLLSSIDFLDFEKEKVDAELSSSLAECIEKYYTDPMFEQKTILSKDVDRRVMMGIVIPYVVEKLFGLLDIDMSKKGEDYGSN